MLEEAIKLNDDDDYYISDLFDLFHAVCNHSRYDKNVWENPMVNHEYPTPFLFFLS